MKRVSLGLIAILLCVGLVFAGGGGQSNSGAGAGTSSGTAIRKEAPELAAKVASGALPPLEQRLPAARDIMVETMDSIGNYGDKLTLFHDGRNSQWYYGMITEEPLFRFKLDGTVEPNVAKGFTVNANSTEYTIQLREGMKWSDGVPFTADDCIFFYEEMILERSFGNAIYNCFYSTNAATGERTLCTMEKINDYEFKVKFTDPSPTFLELVAIDVKWMYAPAHYMKTLLPKFIGEAAAEAKAKEMGFADVAALGRQTGYYHWNIIGRPQVRPWIITNDADSQLMIMERNPYYFKTDAEGKQLPYMNQLHFMRMADPNQKVLKVLAGEVDIDTGLPYTSIAALKQGETQGNYNLLSWDTSAWTGSSNLVFLQSSEDPKLRSLFQNRDFRQAVSISADRKEMATLVSDNWAVPRQSAPPEGSMGYSKAWETKWTEYNPQQARRLLEGIGLKMGTDGYFTHPDGSRLVLEIMTHDNSAEVAKAAELLTEKYLKDIGLHATFSLRDRAYLDEQIRANKVDVSIASAYGINTINLTLRPDSVIPVRNNFSAWYGAFGTWFATNGESGEKPTGDILKLIELYQQMRGATNKAQINELALQMLKLHEENLWQIGFLSATPNLITVNKNVMNFMKNGLWCDEFRNLGISHPAIWYKK